MVWPDNYGRCTIRNRFGLGALSTPRAAAAAGRQLVTDRPLPAGRDVWRLRPTVDGYCQLLSTGNGFCADLTRGARNPQGVVEQEGAPVTKETCGAAETQRWQIARTRHGFRIINAITEEVASATTAPANASTAEAIGVAIMTVALTYLTLVALTHDHSIVGRSDKKQLSEADQALLADDWYAKIGSSESEAKCAALLADRRHRWRYVHP